MYLFLVIATFSDLLLYGLLKQLNVCEKNKKISKIISHPLFFHHHHKKNNDSYKIMNEGLIES